MHTVLYFYPKHPVLRHKKHRPVSSFLAALFSVFLVISFCQMREIHALKNNTQQISTRLAAVKQQRKELVQTQADLLLEWEQVAVSSG